MSGRGDRPGADCPIALVHELIRDRNNLSCTVIFAMKNANRTGEAADEPILARMNLKARAFDEIVGRIEGFVAGKIESDAVKLDNAGDGVDGPGAGTYYVEDASAVPRRTKYSEGPDDDYRALDSKNIARLVAVTFVLEGPSGSAAFIRKFTPGKIITEKRPHFRYANAVIDVEDGNVVDFPEKYDCCLHGDRMLIFDLPNFEDLFGYHERHAEMQRQVFDHWKSGDYVIADLAKYEKQTMGDTKKLRVFRSIRDKEIYRWEFGRIRRFLRSHPVDGIEVSDKPPRIIFKNAYALLHFFNDAHLASDATNMRYLATSKREEGGQRARGARSGNRGRAR